MADETEIILACAQLDMAHSSMKDAAEALKLMWDKCCKKYHHLGWFIDFEKVSLG